MSIQINVDQLISELEVAGTRAGFSVAAYGEVAGYPLLGMIRYGDADSGKATYLSAGIHGDEPAAPLALLELLRSDNLPSPHTFYICPVMNPNGLAAARRENADGIDLNRDYTDFHSPEIAAHQDWVLSKIQSVQLALHLHEDWEAQGFYLYELNFNGHDSRAQAILDAASTHLPIEQSALIDGHEANEGIIRPKEPPVVAEGLPEALFFEQRYACLDYTVETPSGFELEARVAALKAATLAAICAS
ncbi:MAG: DUF2817 domain-containing protein [Verrucomicrobiota bacterium]